MAALQDDFTNIDEPRTNREVLQHIVRMITEDRDDRLEDRELLEKFVTTQEEMNEKMDARIKLLEVCAGTSKESIDTLKSQVKGWNILNSLGVVIASILAALGLKGS